MHRFTALGRSSDQYRIDTGHYPDTSAGLIALSVQPASEPNWHGAYLKKPVLADPWGNAYVYRAPGESGHDYDLMSFGKDGQRGGTGENADISIWDSGR